MTTSTPDRLRGLTFDGEIDRIIDEFGADRVFAYIDDDAVTAGALRGAINSVANQLVALGVEPGDRVGLLGKNSRQWFEFWLAAPVVGARSVPVNVAFQRDFLTQQLREPRVSVLFVDADLLANILAVLDDLPDLRVLIVRGALPTVSPERVRVVGSDYLYEGDPGTAPTGRALAWNEPYCIFYTSGTTGPSKGAVVTQHYLLSGAHAIAGASEFGSTDVLFGAMPLFHFGGSVGLALTALVSGSQLVLDSTFSVSAFWDRVHTYGVTTFVGVGPMVMMLWSLPHSERERTDSFRLMLAAPVPAALHAAIEDRYGCRVRGVYGMTEVFPLCLQPYSAPAIGGAAGRPNPNFELKLCDPDDREVAPGQIGEIVARPRAPHLMFEGYENRPGDTLAQFGNLWFHTGDLARLDDDGNIFFVDRKKDAIRRRGENISSFEVEASVLRHAAVAECAAHAVPSDVGEDEVKICVVLTPGAALTAAELAEHCIEHMPRYMVPRYVEFLDALPKTMTGRVRKVELRSRPIGPETWDLTS